MQAANDMHKEGDCAGHKREGSIGQNKERQVQKSNLSSHNTFHDLFREEFCNFSACSKEITTAVMWEGHTAGQYDNSNSRLRWWQIGV